MKARISLPSGAVVDVEASPEEIRRLAGEPGYKLELLPMVPLPICLCGRAFWSTMPPVCPVHGQAAPFRFTFRPVAAAAAANPLGQSWMQALAGVYA